MAEIDLRSGSNGAPGRIFLSYGHRDATELALRLRTDLETAGYSVWQDEARIRAGHAWTDEIRQGLRESDLVLALLSPHSVRRAGWSQNPDDQDSVCLDEIEYAVDACRIPVLPVMAVTCEPPFRIFRLQYLDCRSWQESEARYQDLRARLLESVGRCLETGRAPLRQWDRLPEPWDFTAFLAERRRRFTGREWLFGQLRDRVTNTSSAAVLLVGAPGVGKSAFLASLIHANPSGQILAYHCCQSATPTTLSPVAFVRSIAAMIAARDPVYAGMLENPEMLARLEEARVADDPAGAFELLILNPLQKLPTPKAAPRLLLVDALDEGLAWPRPPTIPDLLSARLGAYPSWLKVVATSRDDPAIRRRLRTADVLSLTAASKQNRDDLSSHVLERLGAEPLRTKVGAGRREIAAGILARSKGNFLVAVQILDGLATGLLAPEDLETLAPGLEPLYREFFDRLFARPGVDFGPSRVLLQAVLAAQEPPSRADLAAVTGRDEEDELPTLLGRLASFLPPRDGRYSPFHQTLTEWLTSWNEKEDQPVAGEYFVSLKRGHALWADGLWTAYAKGPAAWDLSVRRHLPTHLAGAERWDELSEVLLDLPFLEAKARGPGTTVFGLIGDFELALAGLVESHEKHRLIFLVSESLRLDATFLAQFPESLFQSLWNRGFWHDGPAARSFFAAPPGHTPPWDRPGPKLSELVEQWRARRNEGQPGLPWLRCLRPLPEQLGSAQRGVVRAGEDGFSTVTVSPDGSRILASAPEAGPIGIWDARTFSQLTWTDLPEDRSVHWVRYFSDGPRSGLAAAVTWDGRLVILDDALATVAEAVVTADNSSRVAVSPAGTSIATGDWEGFLSLHDAETLSLAVRWKGHGGQVAALEFSPCGRFLASGEQQFGSGENRVRVWSVDASPPELLAEVSSGNWIQSVCFAMNGTELFWSDYGGTIERWDWPGGGRTRIREPHESPASVVRLLEPDRLLCGVGGAFDPVPIEVWDLSKSRIERLLHGHLFAVDDIVVFPGGKRFVSAGDSTLRIWDLSGSDEPPLEALEPEVSWMEFIGDDWVVTAAESSDTVWIRSLDVGTLVRKLEGHKGTVSSLATATDHRLLACGVADGSVHLWDLASGSRQWQGHLHADAVLALAFSPDRRLLATGGRDGLVCLLDVADGTVIRTVGFHRGDWVQSLAFSSDGQRIASGSFQAIRVWDPHTGHVRMRLTKDDGLSSYYGLWFGPQDKTLLVEGPGEEPTAWRIGTRERLNLHDDLHNDLRAFYNSIKRQAAAAPRWRWDDGTGNGPREQTFLQLVDSRTGAAVAHFPEVKGGVTWHPGGRIWANQRSRYISLLRLEGLPSSQGPGKVL